jgi:subtilisin-like proprotein convertase family protein
MWWLASLLLFAASYFVWRHAEHISASRNTAPVPAAQPAPVAHPPAPAPTKVAEARKPKKAKSYRVSNTSASEKDLLRSSHAILLRNALIDTDRPLKLNIPPHLMAQGAPGSYIVQSDAPLDQRFRDRLKQDGVEFVSYIPNNAALVRATPDQARQMASDAEFQAVIPNEPYFKLAAALMPAAVDNDQPLSEALNVTAFPGQRDATLAALRGLGAQLMGEDNGPFGTTLSVMVPPDKLVAVAQLPLAQEIERYSPRRTLNDLARPMMGISTNSLYITPNYLNLTGAGVTVALNDTGVDTNHPDFKGSNGVRLVGFPNVPYDNDGHGTHVAGSIAGNGSMSGAVSNIVPGETTIGAGFQGKATNAFLFVQSLGLATGTTINDAFAIGASLVSDQYLQTNASVHMGPTNLISNNSWGYEESAIYDMHAASFDQATRDAQPNATGEQPMLFVFAAGGEGNGDNFGEGGTPGSILSPATAKNVITVGSIDEARFITNEVTFDGSSTNDIFFPWTDNDQYVAWFSGAGNVGAGSEGEFGRFKPDVVAPGVFTISCRATNYQDPSNATEITTFPYPSQSVLPGATNIYSLAVPADTELVAAVITPNPDSPQPFPNLDILADPKTPPATLYSTDNILLLSNQLSVGQWYFGVTTQGKQIQPVAYDLTIYLVETNDLGVPITNQNGYFNVISNLNSQLKPWYVYQYGTSMSAAAVSGMLALMQEFLQSHPQLGVTNPSPALLKAMLINGSRSVQQQYDYNPQAFGPNEQGWGLPNLTNSLPLSLTNGQASMLLTDQSTNDALATGQSQTFTINSSDPNATNFPVRVSLIWTDPPGDPAAGVALVNNLNLLVTDASGSNIWLGNDFLTGDIFTEANTGDAPDSINNVQNVYINGAFTPFKFPLSVSVLGMRVNVNAVTTMTNLIVQDYALVVSSDDPALTSGGLTVSSNTPTFAPLANLQSFIGKTNAAGATLLYSSNSLNSLLAFAQSNYVQITPILSGSNYLHERVGANEPNLYANGPLYTNAGIAINTNGNALQWHFFVFTNNQYFGSNNPFGTNIIATNFMVTTFMPPDLATQISPRTNGADLDLYVSTDSDFTNLSSAAFAQLTTNDISVTRGGDEVVIDTNSQSGEVYYIGVKSEDQQAADFGIYAVAQQAPFSSQNPDGSVSASAGPVPIPDALSGPPAILHIFLQPNRLHPQLLLQKLTANLQVQADNPSDYYGVLEHNGTQAVLNNFSGLPGGFTNIYNDLNDGTIPGAINSDGPGTLKDYITTTGAGMWTLTESDNAILQAGQVLSVTLTAYPQPIGSAFVETICGQTWFFDFVDVPNDATNMIISVSEIAGSDPFGIFVDNTDDVGFNSFSNAPITPPGGFLSYTLTNKPPLTGGFWFFGIYNYGQAGNCDTFDISITFGLNQIPNLVQTFTNNTPISLPTDATTNASQICISNGQQVVDLNVGVRLTDPNLDDLTLQLTSPQGTSIVLFENRGGLLATNLGLTVIDSATTNTFTTNTIYTTFTEDTNLTEEPIKFAPPPYAFPVVVPRITNYAGNFDYFTNLELFTTNGGVISSNAAGVYTNGQYVDGWFLETNLLVTNTIISNILAPGPIITQKYILVTNQYFNEVSVATDLKVTGDGTNIVSTNALGPNYLSSNYLALASGRLSQTFTTVPGAAYELVYYARSPGLSDWWPADANVIDLAGTNTATIPYNDVTFDVGEVDRAFTFSGNGVNANNNDHGNEVDFGTNTANVGTNDFTIDFWIKMPQSEGGLQGVLEKRPDCNDDVNQLNIRVGGPLLYAQNAQPGQLSFEVTGDNTFGLGQFVSRGTVNDGRYHHAAFLRDGTNLAIYIDGALDSSQTTVGIAYVSNAVPFRAGQSICVFPAVGDPSDGTIPFKGDIDELDLWQRALTPAEIHAIFQAGTLGKYSTNSLYPNFQVVFDGISTNNIIIPSFAEPGWQLYTNSFVATSNQTTIELLGNPLGVLLDDVSLIQLSYTNYNNFYLPEEPLTPLIGQNPQGCWTLSVWDSRTDSALPDNGALLSWTLQMTTSSTNVNLINLQNGVAYNQAATNGIVYFGVDVPRTANFATNILFNASGPMNLYFNQNALPAGSLPGDVKLLSILAGPSGSNYDVISTQGNPPPLIPGQRYFLGVQPLGNTNETFTIKVNFDVGTNDNIIPLTNEIPLTTNIGTNGPAFYSFLIPTNAVFATFQLIAPTNGIANLYARDGFPVPDPLSFDYESLTGVNQATNDQFIAISTNSLPIPLPVVNTNDILPLTPSTWYLAVYNPGTNTVGYTILATYMTNGPNATPGAMDIINLNQFPTGSNSYTFINRAPAPEGFPTNVLYSFTLPSSIYNGLQFTVTNLTPASTNGALQLLVGEDAFPTPEDFYIGSFNPGANNQFVSIIPVPEGPTFTNMPNSGLLTTSNIWYVAVPNASTNGIAIRYSITATLTNAGAGFQPLFLGASITSPASGFSMYFSSVPGTTYQIQVSSNLANWTVATNITATSSESAYTDAVPVNTQKSRYFRIVKP